MTDSQSDISFGYYIAAYFDLVGQREHIRRLERLPENESEKSDYIQAVKDSVGVVRRFRESFLSFFHSCSEANDSLPDVKDPKFQDMKSIYPGVDIQRYLKLKNTYERDVIFDVRFQTFGDTLIAFSRVADEKNGLRWRTIFSFLASAAGLMPMYLSVGHAFRGGIDVSVGVELVPGEIYGPVLRNVYLLEQHADYARILVGRGLLDLISQSAFDGVTNSNLDHFVGYVQAMSCNHFIGVDSDRYGIVDYASPTILEGVPKEHITLLYKAIKTAYKQVREADEDNDTKKVKKIGRLIEYLESRHVGIR